MRREEERREEEKRREKKREKRKKEKRNGECLNRAYQSEKCLVDDQQKMYIRY